MPQEIRVLCCFKCKMYQVDIVKKTNKWQCKMCQEKQSVFKEFFRGSGAECRLKVQELNLSIHSQKEELENEYLAVLDKVDTDVDLESKIIPYNKTNSSGPLKTKESKWTKYLEAADHKEPNIESAGSPIKKKRKSSDSSQGADFLISKNPRNPMNPNSKWNKYL